jgi:hypothetical protein
MCKHKVVQVAGHIHMADSKVEVLPYTEKETFLLLFVSEFPLTGRLPIPSMYKHMLV